MQFSLHGLLIRYSNVATDIAIAADTGYDAVELHTDKLDRYLAAGFSGTDLKSVLELHGLKVNCIDIVGDVETQNPDKKKMVLKKAELLSQVAEEIDCGTVQLNGFSELEDCSERESIKKTSVNIREICRIGLNHGVRFQYEGAAWTPIHSIEQCVSLVEEVGMENFGLVVDFWHFWASRGGTPDEIAKLNKEIIYGVHIADGFRPGEGEPWVEETLLRGALPGDGEVPIRQWVDAVRATGYDSYFSGEILNDRLWESNLTEISTEALSRMKQYFV
jgi:sugar phosphate isomerase/epimerase